MATLMSAMRRTEVLATSEAAVSRPAGLARLGIRSETWLRVLLVLTDATMLLVATMAASVIYVGALTDPMVFQGGATGSPAWLFSLKVTAVWMLFLLLERLYDPSRISSWGSGEFSRIVAGVTFGAIGLVVLRFLLAQPGMPRAWVLWAWALGLTLVGVSRLTVRTISARLYRKGRLTKRTLVVGTNSEAASVVSTLRARVTAGLRPVGAVASSLKDKLSLDYTPPTLPTLGTARDLVAVIKEYEIGAVIVVSSAFDPEVLERIITELRDIEADVYLSSSLAEVLLSRVSIREVAGMPLISLRAISLSPVARVSKRVFDLVFASATVAVGMPFWLVVAALIKLTSPGPVFYLQERVGREGSRFGMYKFRSMVPDADCLVDDLRDSSRQDGPTFKLRDDPRVTAVGRWMRRFSIDEFPQLINVIMGDMSLVGPRPPLPDETMYYSDHHNQRLDVTPGMTGLWQVSGRSNLSFEEMVSLDLFYIGNWSLAFDIGILIRTIPAVLMAKGAF